MRRNLFAGLFAFLGFICAVIFLSGPIGVRAAVSLGPATRNGDANGDGLLDIADAVHVLMYLFKGGPEPVAFADSPELLARLAALEDRVTGTEAALVDRTQALAALQAKVGELRGLSSEEVEILSHITVRHEPAGSYVLCPEENPTDCAPVSTYAKTIRFEGVNVQVVNGTGSTSELNGLGNLIIGYQEERCCHSGNSCWDDERNIRDGSHNVIVGSGNNYGSYAGAVIGRFNSSWSLGACAIGGSGNIAGGSDSVVLGGQQNLALAVRAGIVAGINNEVSDEAGLNTVISGGDGRVVGGVQCGAE